MNPVESSEDSSSNFVIFDTDVGSDDAWALLMLIKCEEELKKNIKILGITCVHGNTSTKNVAANALRVLEKVNRTDIPVFMGAEQSILPQLGNFNYFHGNDGFGDIVHQKAVDTSKIQKKHAVNAMYEFVNKFPNQITFLLVGPLTNFALCLKMYPDFGTKVKSIVIMGGNTRAVGNASACSEFNFFSDPEAAFIVLHQSINQSINQSTTILPWETCLQDKINISTDWRFNDLALKSPILELLDPVEKKCYLENGFSTWIPCDALAIAAFLFPKNIIRKLTSWHATVELNGKITRGQMIIDHLKNGKENIQLIEEVDEEYFKKIILWLVGHKDVNL